MEYVEQASPPYQMSKMARVQCKIVEEVEIRGSRERIKRRVGQPESSGLRKTSMIARGSLYLCNCLSQSLS